MLNRTARLIAAAAVAMLALPAAAGSWPPTPPRKAPAKVEQAKATLPAEQGAAASRAAGAGFEFVGGETGWQPTGHKFVWVSGSFAHSQECDHAIRVVAGPTPDEIEGAKRLSPGA